MKLWKLSAAIVLPILGFETTPSSVNALPNIGNPILRFPNQQGFRINNRDFKIRPWSNDPLPRGQFDPPTETIELIVKIEVSSALEALENIKLDLEWITDLLIFQLLIPIRIVMLEIIDVTPPVEIGVEREGVLCPLPNGYSTSKFQQTMYFGLQPAMQLYMLSNTALSDRGLAALRWFVKGVSAQFDVDKFNFFWIALEILANEEGETVKEGYIPDCNHQIELCPVCQKKTFLKVHVGKTMKKYLIDKLGLTRDDANQLWKMRQMFHGKNHLTTDAMTDVAKLTIMLYSITLIALKQMLKLPAGSFPNVIPSSPGIVFQNMGINRKIVENDLNT